MPPITDRQRLAAFVQLIGAEPREAEFDEADHLVKLNLVGLNLTELPSGIGEFVHLTHLLLGEEFYEDNEFISCGNSLTALPVSFSQLINLQILRLDKNRLSSLPEVIGQLTNLQELGLNNNGLSSLSEVIGQLTNLQKLGLNNNRLSSLPEVIGQLTNLQKLGLNNNRLSSLPEVIGQLTNLQGLGLDNNGLSSLPEVIGQLTNLQELGLDNNGLSSLPEVIGQLTNLQELYLNNNGLSSLPEVIGQLTNLQILGLGNNRLRSLPEAIGQLTNLQKLGLNNNRLSSLPEVIGQLTNLQGLGLNNNGLSSLPEVIGQLTNLQELYLNNNGLSSLPEVIGQLTNLQILGLGNNRLSSLPEVIGQLTNLQGLGLNNNGLSSLPEVIGQLTNLQELYLDNNGLSSLSEVIGQLTNLQELGLSNNRLSSLPEVIGQLTNLQGLYLNNNRLSSLPEVIGQLTNLQKLGLDNNGLSSLPEVIGQLTNLQKLGLNNNGLSSLPEVIGQLTNLQELGLDNNGLSSLPEAIGQLVNLYYLGLDKNPWRTPPPEIAVGDLGEVQNFLCSLRQGKVLRYYAKLLIVGEGGTGKSSLLRALQGLPFDDHLSTTHGIDTQAYVLPHPSQQAVDLTLHCWDFGGQQIYHTTHQFFMTQRSLYLLVWNARGDTDQGRLDHWLRHIQVLAPDAPVLLVATHSDERTVDFNFARFKQTYFQLVDWVGVSNKTGDGIATLCQKIAETAVNLPLMEQAWPTGWAAVEAALQADARYHIDANEFVAICTENGVTRAKEQATLGGYLHDLGRILYFQDDDALSDFIVLKPNWLTQTMARVLDDPITRYNNGGVLEHADFPRLWNQDDVGVAYERRLYPLLHRLLERFLICYELERTPDGAQHSLVPLLLPHTPPRDLPAWDTVLPDQPEICMVFRLRFMPPGLLSWFIVLTHEYSQNLHWREGVRLHYDSHQAEAILNPSNGEFWLRVRGPVPWNFFNILQHTLNDRILQRYFTGLQYERKVPCLCHKARCEEHPCPYEFDYDKLVDRKQRGRPEIECNEPPYDQVSVSELLEGIHYTTNDRIEARLTIGVEQLLLGQEAILETLELLRLENRQMFEQLNRDFTRLWNLERSKVGSDAPSTFLLMPGSRYSFDLRNLIEQDFTLYLLCQHPSSPHLVKGEKGYPLPRSRRWWAEVAPWLRELVKYLKYLPKGKGIVEAYDEAFYKTIELNVEIFSTTIDIMPEFKEAGVGRHIHESGPYTSEVEAQGAALRALHLFLKEVDPAQHWCNLLPVPTNDGNLFWLCPEHAALYRTL